MLNQPRKIKLFLRSSNIKNIKGQQMVANWKLFKEWEIEEKRSRLKNLSVRKAFKIFEELYSLQAFLPPDELKKTRYRRLDNLANWRKKMDSLKEKLG